LDDLAIPLLCFFIEQESDDFSLSPKVLGQGLLINFGAGKKGKYRVITQEVVGECPQQLLHLLKSEILDFALKKSPVELA
jgi:hypothetical protein